MTVAELIAKLQTIDPATPVGCFVYGSREGVVSPVGVSVMRLRGQCPDHADDFTADGVNVPHWFALGAPSALYHEERGGKLVDVAVIQQGV